MLKSRRGLLAAGLAVAVVGALGVASTLNAFADQTAGDKKKDVAATAAAKLTPPTALPWGSKPAAIKKGKPGQSSKSLRAAGLVAAPNDEGTTAADAYAPKGRTAKNTYLKTEQTTVKPPSPAPSPDDSSPSVPADGDASTGTSASPSASATTSPSADATTKAPATVKTTAAAPVAAATTTTASTVTAADTTSATPSASSSSDGTVHFLYNVGSQAATADGLYASLTVAKPTLATVDYHTLAELALESADGNQIVEVGWNVDRTVNGDADPHLFVYHWVNKTSSCYNACGFVQYSSTLKPGDTLSYDITKKFGIQYFNGAWWIAFDSEWVGYFPDTLWSDQSVTFTQAGYLQVFGEVAAASETPCTQMGNGITPDNTTAAKIASVGYLNGPDVDLNVRSTTDVYAVNALSTRTFRYGGPGVC